MISIFFCVIFNFILFFLNNVILFYSSSFIILNFVLIKYQSEISKERKNNGFDINFNSGLYMVFDVLSHFKLRKYFFNCVVLISKHFEKLERCCFQFNHPNNNSLHRNWML